MSRESRLRAMLDPDSLADWNHNDEDRAAIRWALDAIVSLKSERDAVRKEAGASAHRAYERLKGIEFALEALVKAVKGGDS